MRKLFLDVGGHVGQTLEEVLKSIYHFDLIYCFEPFPPHAAAIKARFASPKLQLIEYGLSNSTGPLEIYSTGSDDMGAGVKRRDRGQDVIATKCNFVKASEFFSDHIKEDDLVIMKLNCEGSECDILNDLIDSGQISKIDNVMIDFDVRKYPHLMGEEPRLKKRMADIGFSKFSLCEDVMLGQAHQERIAHWLRSIPWHNEFRSRAHWVEHLRAALRLQFSGYLVRIATRFDGK
jgi:FkbM family methyltransferase